MTQVLSGCAVRAAAQRSREGGALFKQYTEARMAQHKMTQREVVAARERLEQAAKRGAARAAPRLTYAVPKTIGGAIDLLYKVRGKRFEAQREMEKEKTQENLIELLIFEKFGKSELEGARGKAAQASISRKDVPTIDDDAKFFGHLQKHPEDVDLLQRRLSSEACRLRFDAGKAIPGVGIFTKVSLSLTKRK